MVHPLPAQQPGVAAFHPLPQVDIIDVNKFSDDDTETCPREYTPSSKPPGHFAGKQMLRRAEQTGKIGKGFRVRTKICKDLAQTRELVPRGIERSKPTSRIVETVLPAIDLSGHKVQ
jgi:hypothetical protein